MGKKIHLKEAVGLIWETVEITEEQSANKELPYLFIVGAGISMPEIISANGIVEHCKEKVKLLYKEDEEIKRIHDGAKKFEPNSAGYYSYWFGEAYKNKIHRQKYLKSIMSTAKISNSNLLMAQILNSKKIATTVITPNFDNHLLKSLNLLGNYNVFSANNVMDNIALSWNSSEIQLMHVHGTYEFYDCCNLENEIIKIANGTGIKSTAGTIEEFLKNQSPIVIGYSGWEDDVIMSKIKERLQYAPLPYNLIWFCYSNGDYEGLPDWLKTSDDVVFVLPDTMNSDGKITDETNEISLLPAEDVFTAIIAKFELEDPKLFSNPIQYYIELVDGFLPQNGEIFPIKAWKRRLDYIESQLGDVEKKIIELDSASARKDVIEITRLLNEIEYSFISKDDLEHIINGIIIPSLNNKNRIEDKEDIYAFIEKGLELFKKKREDIEVSQMKQYLLSIIRFLDGYTRKTFKENTLVICNDILEICRCDENFELIELLALGIKSDIVDEEESRGLLNQIVERGIAKIGNEKIARLVLVAVCKQIEEQKKITEEQEKIMVMVLQQHCENVYILESYYSIVLEILNKDISMKVTITDIIAQIAERNLSPTLLLCARGLQCRNEEKVEDKVEIAIDAIEHHNFEKIETCRECMEYAFLLQMIVLGKVKLGLRIEQKYIDLSIKLCYKEEGCRLVSEQIIDMLGIYINSIDSQFEIRELCKKAIEICNRSRLYLDWRYFCGIYIENVDEQEKEEFLLSNDKYKRYVEAHEKMSKAVDEYKKNNVELCRDLLLTASDIYDGIFEGEYNPALLNICFMLRRGEIPELSVSAMDLLNKITWLDNNAFYHINKALLYVAQDEWGKAREEVKMINDDLSSAIEWWSQEHVVGKEEKDTVFLLLALEEKVDESMDELSNETFWVQCGNSLSLPNEVENRMKEIQKKYVNKD